MIRRPPRSTRVRSSAASDVYKRQVLWRTETELILDLRVRKNTNGSCRITRTCLCSESVLTCPLHVLGPLVDACPEGQLLFPGMTRASVLAALRSLLGNIGVERATCNQTHDLRRGHALDLQLAGAPLCAMWLEVASLSEIFGFTSARQGSCGAVACGRFLK